MKLFRALGLVAVLTFSLAAPTEDLQIIDTDTADAQNPTDLDDFDFSKQPPPQGPNCKGSTTCIGFHPRGTQIWKVAKELQKFIAAIPDDKNIDAGQQIACVKGTTGWYGGICAYFQYIKEQKTGAQAKQLVQNIIDLHCKTCGSWPTDGQYVRDGEFTINFVTKAACHGTCV
ncbi:hypothetical protein K491DRAFT_709746 [Lophiostoma macrostomum CBS 122681]|uniref:Killer toxin Kp4 domain-containing protein n=1 Tax=Lophiostoma macrostomum CBS 122681 TaxID=1314788 RepID=A0A6A6TUT2_9PLEO|nr:hypothetical protein K491DRAFT_709746 [Lophiostoma macrostomum CBS 122681]